jgi:hypothetical protein
MANQVLAWYLEHPNIPYCKDSSLVLRAVVFRLFLGIADWEALPSNARKSGAHLRCPKLNLGIY